MTLLPAACPGTLTLNSTSEKSVLAKTLSLLVRPKRRAAAGLLGSSLLTYRPKLDLLIEPPFETTCRRSYLSKKAVRRDSSPPLIIGSPSCMEILYTCPSKVILTSSPSIGLAASPITDAIGALSRNEEIIALATASPVGSSSSTAATWPITSPTDIL